MPDYRCPNCGMKAGYCNCPEKYQKKTKCFHTWMYSVEGRCFVCSMCGEHITEREARARGIRSQKVQVPQTTKEEILESLVNMPKRIEEIEQQSKTPITCACGHKGTVAPLGTMYYHAGKWLCHACLVELYQNAE